MNDRFGPGDSDCSRASGSALAVFVHMFAKASLRLNLVRPGFGWVIVVDNSQLLNCQRTTVVGHSRKQLSGA